MNNIEYAKKTAREFRRLADVPGMTLSAAQEATSRILGYRDWHNLQQGPGDVIADIDGRRWRTLAELGEAGSTAQHLGVAHALFPGGRDVSIPMAPRATVPDRARVVELAELHPLTRGCGEFLGTILDLCPNGFRMVMDENSGRDVVTISNADPNNRSARDGFMQCPERTKAMFLSILGIGETNFVKSTEISVGVDGIRLLMTSNYDRITGYRVHIDAKGTCATDIMPIGYQDPNGDPVQALSAWVVWNSEWLIDTLDVRGVVEHDGDDVWIRVGDDTMDNIVGMVRETMGNHSRDEPQAPAIDWWFAGGDVGPDFGPVTTLMERETGYGEVENATLHEIERARGHLRSHGLELPEALRKAWRAWGSGYDGDEARERPWVVDIRDDGENPTELERRTVDGAIIVLDAGARGALVGMADKGWAFQSPGTTPSATPGDEGFHAAAAAMSRHLAGRDSAEAT